MQGHPLIDIDKPALTRGSAVTWQIKCVDVYALLIELGY
jgi:hypothetical protein